ncbi:mitochondrial amidoxime reducing component 2 isoform X1 [Anoplophora glabripennis]|uniref:mitochondrial amidoxime reducing component 2 isoform X1 n=2 Tax=Anoplophora glabripennis TaxID=217634 RepID=UPI000C780A52|nr:mitochondrial amidoxime reducing component 2 isoform X1 [Anoplophora glabripennis]
MAHNAIFSQHTIVAAGILTVAATTLGTYYYFSSKFKKSKFPNEWRAVGEVRKLCIYPFKSGKKLEVDQAECTKRGLMEEEKFDKSFRLRDRSFVVYNEKSHKYVNSRHYPKMVLVEVRAEHMNHVLLNAPNMNTLLLQIPDRTRNKEVVVKHYRNEEIYSIDCGNEVASWISQYILGEDSGLRIAFHDGSYERDQINNLYKDKIDYYKRGLGNESSGLNSDLTSMHIINQASVADINRRMNNSDINADYFRSNLVVDGAKLKPYEEDDWLWIKVGDVIMKNVVECMRCSITTTNPETGVRRDDKEPLTTMKNFRISKGPEKAPVMGILLEVFQTGNISVGDVVYVGKD